MERKAQIKTFIWDILYAMMAGVVVGTAYHFFQNSNGFAPGGVGGLATITHHFLAGRIDWSILMVAFNLPIFVLVSAIVNKKLGLMLSVYMVVQSFIPRLYTALGALPYCALNNGTDFNIMFACCRCICLEFEPDSGPFIRLQCYCFFCWFKQIRELFAINIIMK